jgi:hypothetical protein
VAKKQRRISSQLGLVSISSGWNLYYLADQGS